jgi:hypothetical protein
VCSVTGIRQQSPPLLWGKDVERTDDEAGVSDGGLEQPLEPGGDLLGGAPVEEVCAVLEDSLDASW